MNPARASGPGRASGIVALTRVVFAVAIFAAPSTFAQTLVFSCPPGNNPTASITAAARTKITCQIAFAGAATNARFTLTLPATAPVTVVNAGTLPDGLPNKVTNAVMNPAIVDWKFGDPNAGVSAPTNASGYPAGTWNAPTREYRWGPLNITTALVLRVDFFVPGGIPPGTYVASLATTINAVAQPTLARSINIVVPSSVPTAPSTLATTNTQLGGTFMFAARIGGALGSFTSAGWDAQTNASLILRLPYWDPATSTIKSDGNFATVAGAAPLVDFPTIEAKLDPNDGSKLEYFKPAGSDVGPVASGFNDGKLFAVDRTKNTITATIGALAFPYVTNWNFVVRGTMKVPPTAPLVGKNANVTACLQSDQVSAGTRCSAPVNTRILAVGDALLRPSITLDQLYNGIPSPCENTNTAFPPNKGGSTRITFANNSGETFQNFVLTVQLPGASARNTVLGTTAGDPTILLGGSQAANVDTDVWLSWTLGLSSSGSDYSNLANLTLRSLPAPSANFVTCPRALAAFCRKADTDAASIVVRDVTELRLAADTWEPAMWRHAKSTSNGDQLQFSWTPDVSAPTNSFDGGACSLTNGTGGAFTSTASLRLTGVPELKSTYVSDVNGSVKKDVFNGTRTFAGLSTSLANSVTSGGPTVGTGHGAFAMRLSNTGYPDAIFGPFELETNLPPNAPLDWSDVTSPSIPADRIGAVETYSPAGAGQWSRASNATVTTWPLTDGTGRTHVKVVVNTIDTPAGVPQVANGRPYLVGATGPNATTGTSQIVFPLRMIFLPGVPARAYNEDTYLRYFIDDGTGPVAVEERFNYDSTKIFYDVQSALPLLKFSTAPASADGSGSPLTVPPGSTFWADNIVDNFAYLASGVPDPEGSKGSATNTVVYQRIPRAADQTGSPAPLDPIFVEARGAKRPELPANDVTEIWVTAGDPAEATLSNATTLVARGFVRCVGLADAVAGALACSDAKARSVLGGTAPRWVAFVIGTANVTDATPRGVPPLNGATRVNRPYDAWLVLRDPGSPRGSQITTHAVVAVSEWPSLPPSADAVFRIGNGAPIWASTPAQTIGENASLNFTVTASDPNAGDALTYDVVSATLPRGATFNALSRTFSWTPDYTQSGQYEVTFLASDGLAVTPVTVSIEVFNTNNPPSIVAVDQKIHEGGTLDFTISPSDPDNEPVTVTCADMPPGMTYDDATRTFHYVTTHASVGPHTLTLVATDPFAATFTKTIVVTVNGAPVFTMPLSRTVAETSTLSFKPTATDNEGEAVAFDVDPATLPPNSTWTPATKTFAFTPDYEQSGHYDVAFLASDGYNPVVRRTVGIDVTNVNRSPSLTVVDQRTREGGVLDFTLTVTDPDRHAVTVTATNLPSGMTYDDATRAFHWATTHASVGTWLIRLDALDPDGGTDTKNLRVVVNGAPIFTMPRARTVAETSTLAFTLTASDNEADALVFAEDRATFPPGADYTAGTREFRWTPTYEQSGHYDVAFTVSDPTNLPVRVTVGIDVTNVNRVPILSVADQSTFEGGVVDFTVTTSDPDGQDVVVTCPDMPPGLTYDDASRTFHWATSHASVGTTVIHPVATDPEGGATSRAVRLVVNGAPIFTTALTQNVDENAALSVLVDASDFENDLRTYAVDTATLPAGATWTAATRRLQWTPTFEQAGRYDVAISVTDGRNPTVARTLVIVVRNVNRVPVLAAADQKIWEGGTLDFTATTSDPDGQDVVITCADMPAGMTYDDATRTFHYVTTRASIGVHLIHPVATDPEGGFTTRTVRVVVNAAPVFTMPLTRRVGEDVLLSFRVDATDVENDALVFDLDPATKPATATWNPATRTFAWTPDFDAAGRYDVTFTVSDGFNPVVRGTVRIDVVNLNRSPRLFVTDQATFEGGVLDFTIAATDPDGQAVAVTCDNLPAGMTYDDSLRTFHWATTHASVGTHVLNLVATDVDGEYTEEYLRVVVNGAPIFGMSLAQNVAETATLTFTVEAADNENDALIYALTSAELPQGATYDPATRLFTWTPGFEQSGTYEVSFVVTDGINPPVHDDVTLTVVNTNRLPSVTADEQRTFEGGVLDFTATTADPDRQHVTVTCADLPAGMTYDDASRAFHWETTHDSVGVHLLHLVATDPDGGIGRSTVRVSVNGAPTFAMPLSRRVNETATLTFTVEASDHEGDPLTYALDAATLPEGATWDNASRTFSWTPGYEQFGRYDVAFTVSDAINLPVRRAVSIDVGNVNRAPSVSGSPQATYEGGLLVFTVDASDPDRQPVTVTCADLPTGMTYDDASRTFRWPTSHDSVGVHLLHLVVTDPEGDTGTALVPVVVNGAPRFVMPLTYRVVETRPITIRLEGTDHEDDELTFSAVSTSLPRGAVFDPATSALLWTPDYEQSGHHDVTFVADDGVNPPVLQRVGIDVQNLNRAPAVTVADHSAHEGDLLAFSIAASDPDRQAVTVTTDELPKGLTFDAQTLRFEWPTVPGSSGTYRVFVTGTDPEGATDHQTLTLTISRYGRPPVLDPLPSVVVHEGRPVSFTLHASDRDRDELTFALASGREDGMDFDPATRTFTWTPGPDTQGLHTLEFSVTDQDGEDRTQVELFVVDVNRPPDLTIPEPPAVDEGSLLTFTLAATDPDGDAVSFDTENLPAGATFDRTTGTFEWTPTNSQSGVLELQVLAIDARGGITPGVVVVTVNDLDSLPEITPLEPRHVGENELLTVFVTANDLDGDPITFGARDLPEGAEFDPGLHRFRWRPAYTQAGDYDVTFLATSRGHTATAVLKVTVEPVNRPVRIGSITTRTVITETPLEVTLLVEDPDEDAVSCTARDLPPGARFDDTRRSLLWTPGILQAGAYEALITCVDTGGTPVDTVIHIEVLERDYRRAGGGLASALGCASTDPASLGLLALVALALGRRRRRGARPPAC